MNNHNRSSYSFWEAILGLFVLVLWPFTALIQLATSFVNRDAVQEKRAREHTWQLYRDALKVHTPMSMDEFFKTIFQDVNHLPDSIFNPLADIAIPFYEEYELTEPPVVCNSIEGGKYRDRLASLHTNTSQKAADGLRLLVNTFCDQFLTSDTNASFTVPVRPTVPFISSLILIACDHELSHTRILANLNRLGMPNGYKGDLLDYLHGTPFTKLFDIQVPFSLSTETRFEGHHILAPPGTGKTQCIQYMICKDIEEGHQVIVMDSQGEMLEKIARLDCDVLYIDPREAIGINPLASHHAIELLNYMFANLLGAEMTPKQSVVWRYAVRACLSIPNATLFTVQKALTEDGYLDSQFNDKTYTHTKEEIGWRLSLLLENPILAKMFTGSGFALNLSHRVICLDTNKDLLGQQGSQILGRFYIALLLQATQHRASMKPKDRTPLFFYVDEAQDYIANDPNITVMLDQARKQKVGLVLAHQRCNQLSSDVLDAVLNVAIKFAAGTNDARTMARHLHTEADFISNQPKGHFAAHVRGRECVSLRVPFGYMEAKTHKPPREVASVPTITDGIQEPPQEPQTVDNDEIKPGKW